MDRTLPANGLIVLSPLLALFMPMQFPALLVLLALTSLYALPQGEWKNLKKRMLADRATQRILFCVLAVPAVSAVWSVVPMVSLVSFMRIACLCLIGWGLFHAAEQFPPPSRKVIMRWAAVFAFCELLLVSEILPGGGIIRFFSENLGGDYQRYMIKSVNRSLCAMAVLVFPLCFVLIKEKARGYALGLLLGMAVPVACMQSTSAILGVALGTLAYAALSLAPRTVGRSVAVLVPLCFFALPFVLSAWLNGLSVEQLERMNDVSSGRAFIWLARLSDITSHFWLGGGMNSSSHIPMAEDSLQMIRFGVTPLHSHNAPLHILLELGVVGLFMQCIALALLLLAIVRCGNNDPAFAVISATSVIAYLAAGAVSFNIWQNWWVAMIWIVAYLLRRVSYTGQ